MGDRDADYDDNEERMQSGGDDEETESDEPVTEKITLKARKLRKSSGKWKLYYDKRVFRKEWEEAFPWVEEDPEDPKFAICRACNKKIKAHKGILETHQKTKKHLKNLSGSDDLEEPDGKEERIETAKVRESSGPAIEQVVGDDQISFFAESSVDAAHQAITSLIDKLVEKYHENKLDNLKSQNEAMMQLHKQRLELLKTEDNHKALKRQQQETFSKEAQEARMKYLQIQHDSKITAMEDERDAKMRAAEQKLMFARQEYEKKVQLLDVQLSCMK